jgi:1-phosphofructokinase family hexose kinase
MIYTLTLNPALDRELTVSKLIFDDVLRANMLRLDCGGKGFNVSRALKSLGTDSVALGFVGGRTGQYISDGLARLGIATDFVEVAGETRTNVSIISESQPYHLKVNEPGPIITSKEERALLEKVAALAKAGDWWVLSGSLSPGVSPTVYARIIHAVQAAGAKVILDASGPSLRHGCQAGPFLAKPNAAEAVELTGINQLATQPQTVAGAIHAMGVNNVMISMGKAGAVFSDGSRMWLAQSPKIEERNPIGAGDSAVAGLVWGLSQNLDWPDILRWSMACGAAAASLAGTAVGTRRQVEELAGQVELKSLD